MTEHVMRTWLLFIAGCCPILLLLIMFCLHLLKRLSDEVSTLKKTLGALGLRQERSLSEFHQQLNTVISELSAREPRLPEPLPQVENGAEEKLERIKHLLDGFRYDKH
jgi:hypothetical protein